MPQAIKIERGIIPPRSFEKPTQKCADFGISLFDSKESATKFYFGILRPIVREKLGYTHISTGEIKKEDGVITEVEKSGHFNLHEYASSVCLKNFILVEALQESHGNC